MLSKKLYLFIISINIFIAHANELTKPKITIFKTPTHEQKNVSYNNGSIFLKGFDGPGSIEVYSIMANFLNMGTLKEQKISKDLKLRKSFQNLLLYKKPKLQKFLNTTIMM